MIYNSHLVTLFFVVDSTTVVPETVNKVYGKELVSITTTGKTGESSTITIDKNCVDCGRLTTADEMKQYLKKVTLKLKQSVNGGNPVVSQDYVVRIDFKNGFGFSDEDQYIKHAAVRATKDMSAADFYNKLAISIFKNLIKMYSLVLVVGNGTDKADHIVYDKNGIATGLAAKGETEAMEFTEEGITIESVAPKEYNPGLTNVNLIDFNIIPTTIMVDGVEEEWGEVDKDKGEAVGNGMKVADMEWYFLGDRGDMERGTGGPLRSNNTECKIDASKEYDIIDIQYHWQGDNTVNVGKSPIHVIFAAETGNSELANIKTLFGDIIEEKLN